MLICQTEIHCNITCRDIGEEELKIITEVLQSGVLDSIYGEKTKQFEREFAGEFGVKYAVASNSGTAAIHTERNPVLSAPITEIASTAAK